MIGLEINGYQVRAVIGSGGMGKVYLGVHPLIGAKAAIKVLLPHFAADQAQTDRFIREARVLSSLNHDRIVKITGFGVLPDGRNYMVMEHLEGAPLSRLIELESPMPASKVLALVDQILDALSAAHAAGIVHRDLKPMNVLVLRSGTDRKVKLLDFGLARAQALRLPQDLERALDKGSLVMGTPEYVPPEQVRGQPPTPASDLYSLGVIMFELLTKRLPFSGETAGDMVAHHLRDQAPRVSSVIPVVPALLDELVAAMLSKVPEERGAPAEKIRRIVQKLAKDLAEQDAAFRRGTTTNSGAWPKLVVSPPDGSRPAPAPDPTRAGAAAGDALRPQLSPPGGAPQAAPVPSPGGGAQAPAPSAPRPAPSPVLVDPDWVKATTRAQPLLPEAPAASSWRPVLYAAGLILAVLAGVVLARHPQVDRLVSALPGMQPAAPPDEVAPGTGGAGEPVAAPHALEGQPGDPARGTPVGPGPDGVPALGGAGPSPAAMDGGAPARVEDSEGAAAAVGAAAPQPQEDACSQLDTWKDELPSRLNEDSRRYLARKPRARLDRPPLSELEDLLQDGRNVRATAECLAVQRRVEAWRKKNLRAR